MRVKNKNNIQSNDYIFKIRNHTNFFNKSYNLKLHLNS